MATIFSHPAMAIAGAVLLGSHRVSTQLLVVAVICTILPDADVIAFKLGISYAHELGHRGATHSLFFALLCGALAAMFARQLQAQRWLAFSLCALATASHAVLDACTTGGLGVAIFWPWQEQRYFLPWQFIQVSPIGSRFFSERGLAVLSNELLTIWLPVGVFCLLCWGIRRHLKPHTLQA